MGLLNSNSLNEWASAIPDRAKAMYQGLLSAPSEIGQLFDPKFQQGLLATANPEFDRQKAMQVALEATGMAPMGIIGSMKNVLTPIYHGTTPNAARAINKTGFDISKSADGTIWFTSNPKIGEVAATGKGAVVKRLLDEKKLKLGGWDEADKYGVDELIAKGYDGLKLEDGGEVTYQIFHPEKLKK